MIQDHEIDAWLGPVELTEEQRDEFTRLVRAHDADVVAKRRQRVGEDYDAQDYREEDTAAWVAALEIAEGTFDLAARGSAYVAARDAAYQGAVMATLAGISEVEAARSAAISRPTLRKALEK